jgi:hypothetical protein
MDEFVDSEYIKEFFSSTSYNRNHKLSYLLDEKEQFVIINFSNIGFGDDTLKKDFDAMYLSIVPSISNFVSYLQSTIYTLNNTDSSIKYSLILLSNTYKSTRNTRNFNQRVGTHGKTTTIQQTHSIKGGMSLIYQSELYLRLNDGYIIIEKDRYHNTYSTNLTSELRQISINHILNENT